MKPVTGAKKVGEGSSRVMLVGTCLSFSEHYPHNLRAGERMQVKCPSAPRVSGTFTRSFRINTSTQRTWLSSERVRSRLPDVNLTKWVKSLSHVWLLATPWTVAHQAPPSMGFSREEYRSGPPLPSPEYIFKKYKNRKTVGWQLHGREGKTICSQYYKTSLQSLLEWK